MAIVYSLEEIKTWPPAGPDTGVFTDGSAQPNPGPGGWGAVFVKNGEIVKELSGHHPDTTNNRMELTGLIEAYKVIAPHSKVTVYTDSNLCVQTINTWAKNWEARGWKKKDGPIKNIELVQELYTLHKERPGVTLQWIKAHNGWKWNEYADTLSTAWSRKTG